MKEKGRNLSRIDNRRRGIRLRRQPVTAEKLHLLACNEFLGELLRVCGIARGVAVDYRDLAPVDGVPVHRQIGLNALAPLLTHDGERSGERSDHAKLDG